MVGIRTSTLRPNVKLGFDLHLMISGKYLLYIHQSDEIEAIRLEKLRTKNVRKVFIHEHDRAAYEAFLQSSVQQALSDKNMSIDTKSNIIVGNSKAAVEDMFADPEKKESFTMTQSAAQHQVALLMSQPAALEQMMKVQGTDKTTYQHSVNVATIAVGLAAFLGAPENVCQAVGTGALLHDIGKKLPSSDGQEAKEINKRLEDMSKEEREKYIEHPRQGAAMLQGKKYISKDILDIILLHEERLDGKGYPAGLKKLDQIFQLVGLANMYDREVTFFGKTPKESYEMIAAMKPAPYDEDLIAGLKDVLVANKIY